MLAPVAIARNIELSLDAPNALHHTLDVHAFNSIVRNLLGNALVPLPENGQCTWN